MCDFLEIFLVFVAGLVGLGLTLFLLFTGIYVLIDRPSCLATGTALQLKTEWGFWSGCIITLKDGQKLTSNQFNNYYRVNQKQ